jgi:hypothetical protein
MSIRGALPSGGKSVVPFRPREHFAITQQGLVNDLAMMNIRKVINTDRTGSVLERLKTQPDNMSLRCPERTCRMLTNEECSTQSFCAVNMDVTGMKEVTVRSFDPLEHVTVKAHGQPNGLRAIPGEWEKRLHELGLNAETTVDEMLSVYVKRGDPDGAARLFAAFEGLFAQVSENNKRCHAVLFPFQTIFADRVLLPRESGLAYWSVGSGKTAGAAALMLQAGTALTQGVDHPNGHELLGPQELPIHFFSVLNDFGRKSADAARKFTHRVRDYYAILTQTNLVDGLPTCFTYDTIPQQDNLRRWATNLDKKLGNSEESIADYSELEDGLLSHIESLVDILGDVAPRFAESLVLLNDIHRMSDDVYLLFKAVNMLCMYGGEELSPGYPPVIAAFTGTPAGGGFRKFLMILDLLDNATSQASDAGSRQAHALLPPGDLTPELEGEANIAESGRVLNEATVLTNETTRDMVEWMGLSPYQRGRRGEQVLVPVRDADAGPRGSVPITRFAKLLGFDDMYRAVTPDDPAPTLLSGTVMEVRQDGEGAVVLQVQLDQEDDEPPRTVLVPAMLAQLQGSVAPKDGMVALAYTGGVGPSTSTVVTPGAKADDKPDLIVVNRALTLTHATNDTKGEAEKPFEVILMEHFNLVGKMSYVNLYNTGLYPRKQFNLDVSKGSTLPESPFLTGLIDPLFVMRTPEARLYGGPDSDKAWKLLRAEDARNAHGKYKSFKFSNKSTGKSVYYTTLFYLALFEMVFSETAWYLSLGESDIEFDNFPFADLDLVGRGDVTRHVLKLKRWKDILSKAADESNNRLAFLRALGDGITPPKLRSTFGRVMEAAAADEIVFNALGMPSGPILMYATYRSFPGIMALCELQTRGDGAPLVDPMAWLNNKGEPILLRVRDQQPRPAVKLMLMSDKAASDDFDDFSIDKSGRPRQLVFYEVPKSKDRMLQIEGRIHRNLCDDVDQHAALRTSTYWVMCGNWPGHDDIVAVREQIRARDVRRLGRPAEGPTETRTNAWVALTAEADRVQSSGLSHSPTFDELNFIECSATHSDCRLYLDLQTDVAGYEVFFESLAQQVSMNRSVGDELVSGPTVQWTEFRKSHNTTTMLELCDDYLNHVGRQPAETPVAEGAPEGATPEKRRRGGRRGRWDEGRAAPDPKFGPTHNPDDGFRMEGVNDAKDVAAEQAAQAAAKAEKQAAEAVIREEDARQTEAEAKRIDEEALRAVQAAATHAVAIQQVEVEAKRVANLAEVEATRVNETAARQAGQAQAARVQAADAVATEARRQQAQAAEAAALALQVVAQERVREAEAAVRAQATAQETQVAAQVAAQAAAEAQAMAQAAQVAAQAAQAAQTAQAQAAQLAQIQRQRVAAQAAQAQAAQARAAQEDRVQRQRVEVQQADAQAIQRDKAQAAQAQATQGTRVQRAKAQAAQAQAVQRANAQVIQLGEDERKDDAVMMTTVADKQTTAQNTRAARSGRDLLRQKNTSREALEPMSGTNKRSAGNTQEQPTLRRTQPLMDATKPDAGLSTILLRRADTKDDAVMMTTVADKQTTAQNTRAAKSSRDLLRQKNTSREALEPRSGTNKRNAGNTHEQPTLRRTQPLMDATKPDAGLSTILLRRADTKDQLPGGMWIDQSKEDARRVLGLKDGQGVDTAFKRAAKLIHPDKNLPEYKVEMQQRFKRISKAKSILNGESDSSRYHSTSPRRSRSKYRDQSPNRSRSKSRDKSPNRSRSKSRDRSPNRSRSKSRDRSHNRSR